MEPNIDFTKYTYAELLSAQAYLNKDKYPGNYQKILDEIKTRPEYSSPSDAESIEVPDQHVREHELTTHRKKLIIVFATLQCVIALVFFLNTVYSIYGLLQMQDIQKGLFAFECILAGVAVIWTIGAYKCTKFTVFGWYTVFATTLLEAFHITTDNLIWKWNLFGGVYGSLSEDGKLSLSAEAILGSSNFHLYFGSNSRDFDVGVNFIALAFIGIMMMSKPLFSKAAATLPS